jgi:hypothetical protein
MVQLPTDTVFNPGGGKRPKRNCLICMRPPSAAILSDVPVESFGGGVDSPAAGVDESARKILVCYTVGVRETFEDDETPMQRRRLPHGCAPYRKLDGEEFSDVTAPSTA